MGVFFLGQIVMLFLGWDPLVAFVLSVSAVPLMLVLVLLAIMPITEARLETRVLAVMLPVAIILTSWPAFPQTTIITGNWPFRLSHLLHRPALERFAAEIRASGRTPATADIGVLSFIDITFTEPQRRYDSNLGLQITGDGGGGVHLVQTSPNATFVWWNTNWEIDLGNGWYLVYQD